MMNDDDFIPEVSNDVVSDLEKEEQIPIVAEEVVNSNPSRNLATEKGSFACDQCTFFAKTKLGLC